MCRSVRSQGRDASFQMEPMKGLIVEQVIYGADGKPLYAVEVVPVEGPLRGAAEVLEKTAQDLKAVGVAISESCSDIFTAVREGARDAVPDELEVSFGVTLTGEAGIAIIKATGGATFTVTARWKEIGKSSD